MKENQAFDQNQIVGSTLLSIEEATELINEYNLSQTTPEQLQKVLNSLIEQINSSKALNEITPREDKARLLKSILKNMVGPPKKKKDTVDPKKGFLEQLNELNNYNNTPLNSLRFLPDYQYFNQDQIEYLCLTKHKEIKEYLAYLQSKDASVMTEEERISYCLYKKADDLLNRYNGFNYDIRLTGFQFDNHGQSYSCLSLSNDLSQRQGVIIYDKKSWRFSPENKEFVKINLSKQKGRVDQSVKEKLIKSLQDAKIEGISENTTNKLTLFVSRIQNKEELLSTEKLIEELNTVWKIYNTELLFLYTRETIKNLEKLQDHLENNILDKKLLHKGRSKFSPNKKNIGCAFAVNSLRQIYKDCYCKNETQANEVEDNIKHVTEDIGTHRDKEKKQGRLLDFICTILKEIRTKTGIKILKRDSIGESLVETRSEVKKEYSRHMILSRAIQKAVSKN